MAKFVTHASGAIWWLNLELMQVEPPLVGEITQALDAVPWVRCASGNVFNDGFPYIHCGVCTLLEKGVTGNAVLPLCNIPNDEIRQKCCLTILFY